MKAGGSPSNLPYTMVRSEADPINSRPWPDGKHTLMLLQLLLRLTLDRTSCRISSVWTLFGSVSVDPAFEPYPKSRPPSSKFHFAEKDEYTLGRPTCPCPPPTPAEPRPSPREAASAYELHGALPPLHGRTTSTVEVSLSAERLVLANTDHAMAKNPEYRELGRKASRTTVSSGRVQRTEAV